DLAVFAPSGKLILSAAANGRLQLWRAPAADAPRTTPAADPVRQPLAALSAPHAGPLASLLPLAVTDPAALPLCPLGPFEIQHYQLPNAAQARCAVFGPGEKVFLSGGTDRVIRIWAVPEEWARQSREAVLNFVGSEIETGTDLVRVQATRANRFTDAR